jgi:hypothetical protein
MKLLFTGESDFRRKNLYKLIFRGLTGGYTPILLTGDRGFDLYDFLRVRKKLRIPMASIENLQFASAVNGHHIKTLIANARTWNPRTSFLIFLDFTGHYLDETIPEEIRLFMFHRDLHSLFTDSSPQPAFFFESSRIYRNTIQAKLKSILESRVKIHLDQKEGKLLLRRFALNHLEKKEFFEGSTHSELFYLCEKLFNSLRKFHVGTPYLSV